jgi:hypothetical protein
MAVIDNRSTEDGDVLIIRPETPIIGLLSLLQFTDTTTGEDPNNYFLKEFRYSVNGGLTFEPWTELTLINISAVSITRYNQFVIEYRYTRIGTPAGPELTFENILVSGDINAPTYPIYDKTPFNDFFEVNNINVFGWALNVLEKLYRKGLILPDYIQRADNNSNLEDEDFIVYWNSITHLFAILVYFARQFEDFETNEILLQEFIVNKDIIFSDINTIDDLLYIYANYISEYKKRGTLAIIDKKADGATVDGELLRLIEYISPEEFIFCLFQNFESGWCIGKSSPMWWNTENIINIIKGYEYTKDVVSKLNFPLVGSAYITLTSGYLVLDEIPSSVICGIADDSTTTFRIPIAYEEDYEISFRVKQESLLSILSFGVSTFNSVGVKIDDRYFFQNQAMLIADTEYWVRGVMWNYNKTVGTYGIPNIGIGANFKSDTAVAYIIPIITVVDAAGITTKTYLRDIKVRPLKLNFSRGQLGVHSIIYLLLKNNNGQYSSNDIRDIADNKLVPYKSFVKIKDLLQPALDCEFGDGSGIILT